MSSKDQCAHWIHPDSCVHCNPDYAGAEIEDCDACGCMTWHVDGECLRCRAKARGELDHR